MDNEEQALGELIPLAMTRAHYYERIWGQTTGEFESAALLGAWDAIKRYQPDKGASLFTYARHRIDGEIIDWHRRERQQRGGSRNPHMQKIVYCVDFSNLGIDEDGITSEASTIEKMEQGRTHEKGYTLVESRDLLEHLKVRMNAREWDIMVRCVCNEETMKSVGESYGVSESRICQILPVALMHAKKIIEGMEMPGNSYAGLDREDLAEALWMDSMRS